jgi:hypothetical protein
MVLYEIRGVGERHFAYRRGSLSKLKDQGFSFDMDKAKKLMPKGEELYATLGPDKFILVRIQ